MTHLGDGYSYCTICGTVQTARGQFYVPALVSQCRIFEKTLLNHTAVFLVGLWRSLGIAGAIAGPPSPNATEGGFHEP